jgi:hypothetical protein
VGSYHSRSYEIQEVNREKKSSYNEDNVQCSELLTYWNILSYREGMDPFSTTADSSPLMFVSETKPKYMADYNRYASLTSLPNPEQIKVPPQ